MNMFILFLFIQLVFDIAFNIDSIINRNRAYIELQHFYMETGRVYVGIICRYGEYYPCLLDNTLHWVYRDINFLCFGVLVNSQKIHKIS